MILCFKLGGYIRIHKFYETEFCLTELLVGNSLYLTFPSTERSFRDHDVPSLSPTLLDKGSHSAMLGR